MENYSDPEEDETPAQQQEAADPHRTDQVPIFSQQPQLKQHLHTAEVSEPPNHDDRQIIQQNGGSGGMNEGGISDHNAEE